MTIEAGIGFGTTAAPQPAVTLPRSETVIVALVPTDSVNTTAGTFIRFDTAADLNDSAGTARIAGNNVVYFREVYANDREVPLIYIFYDGTALDATKFAVATNVLETNLGATPSLLVPPNLGRIDPDSNDITTSQASGFTAANTYLTSLDAIARDIGALVVGHTPPRTQATDTPGLLTAQTTGWVNHQTLSHTVAGTEYYINAAGDTIIDSSMSLAGAMAGRNYWESPLNKPVRSAFGSLWKPLTHTPFGSSDQASDLQENRLLPIVNEPGIGPVMWGNYLETSNTTLATASVNQVHEYRVIQEVRQIVRNVVVRAIGNTISRAETITPSYVNNELARLTGTALRPGSSFAPDSALNTDASLAVGNFFYRLTITPVRSVVRITINESVNI